MSRPAFRKTPKQHELMEAVLSAADRGEFLTIIGLKDAVSYGPEVTYQAILCSVGFLKKAGMIVLERSGRFKIIKPTAEAYANFRSAS